MIPSIDVGLDQVAAALVLVAIAVVASRWRDAGLEEDIAVAVARSFVQLVAIGYVIDVIFEQDDAGLVIALLAVMVIFGALTARRRAAGVPDAFWPLLAALALAAATTLGLVLALGIFEPEPRYVVPVGGMVIGNAMTAAAVALNRLGEDVGDRSHEIEASLALGATSTQAMNPLVRRSLRSGMIPLIDSTKTTGLIFFPGAMVGLLLGRRRSGGRRAAAADPPLLAAGLGRHRGADGDHAGAAELLHLGAPAARATAALKRGRAFSDRRRR